MEHARRIAERAEGSRLSREAKIGVVAVGTVVAIRIIGGNFIVNDWEGWGTFLAFTTTVVLEGLILWALVFGLLVRLAARSRGSRPALAAVITGVLALFSLAIPYSAPQAVLGAGAVALGLVASERPDQRRARQVGAAAVATGLIAVVLWLSFVALTFVTGDWPGVSD